jgi:NADH dehydrogenase (ubiquinone) 1 alpha subcomplex subunit 9
VESVAKAVKFSNVVVNAAGRDYETRNFKFDDVHVTGARAIAEACRAAGVKRLIHFSALGADPNSPSKFLRSKVTFNGEVVYTMSSCYSEPLIYFILAILVQQAY